MVSATSIWGFRTGSVHGQVEVFNVSEATKYFAKVVFRDVLGQFLNHDLKSTYY
jgi:hypothetical protein